MTDVVVRHRWLRTAVSSVRTATTAAALTMLLGLGAVSVLVAPQPQAPEQLGLSSRPLDAMMERNRCSFTGFGKAIIRTPAGATQLVSFERGWAVFSGEAAGELVAVCLGPQEPAVQPLRR